MEEKCEYETKEYTDIEELARDLEIANEDPSIVFRILWWKNPVQVKYTTHIYDEESETACLDIEDED